MKPTWLLRLIQGLLFLVNGYSLPACAHKPSDSYMHINIEHQQVQVRWDIALRDLENAIGLDSNEDGQLSWGEIKQATQTINAYALSRFTLIANRQDTSLDCAKGPIRHALDQHSDGTYLVLQFDQSCPEAITDLTLTYQLFAGIDANHRAIVQIHQGTKQQTTVIGASHIAQHWSLDTPPVTARLNHLIQIGITHIGQGYDHLAFLMALLLPVVLTRQGQQWQAITTKRIAFVETARLVTAFTVAHSVTLGLAYYGIVNPSPRWVESGIALSVMLTALNNLWPVFTRHHWLAAFFFGLIHGFGFATALTDTLAMDKEFVLTLLGFNLGIELGQLLIVALVLPILLMLRHTQTYQRRLMPWMSALLVFFAIVWLLERITDLKLLGI